jgi:hypothetical protein
VHLTLVNGIDFIFIFIDSGSKFSKNKNKKTLGVFNFKELTQGVIIHFLNIFYHPCVLLSKIWGLIRGLCASPSTH